MSEFILKLIAMSSMLIDHIGFQFMGDNQLMRSVGRLAFILYAFLIAESYYHLRDKPDRLKVHAAKLFLLCFVTEIPYDLFDHNAWIDFSTQSVLPTLMLGFIALILSGAWMRKWQKNRTIAVTGSVVICLLTAIASYIALSEYKFAGVLLIAFFYLYLRKVNELRLPMRFLALAILFAVYLPIYIWSRAKFGIGEAFAAAARAFLPRLAGTLCTILPIALYNRKLGYNSKWFGWFYSVFYPLQFVALVIVRYMVFRV